jgi:rhamnose utilization protein RhaD (predicted bifunctional aldolase and dehydrogenase)
MSQLLAVFPPCFSRGPSRAASAAAMAAELRTANVKRVGRERATFVGYAHPAGMTVSRFRAIYAEKKGLEDSTLQFYEVTREEMRAIVSTTLTDHDAVASKGALFPDHVLDTDTWLLAVGNEQAGE